jgi:SAM-dependent methyltransferase
MSRSLSDTRTQEQIREHYEIEKSLATRLRNSTKQQRETLYSAVYEELFARVPHHLMLTRKSSTSLREAAINRQLAYLNMFLEPDDVFLEIGPGDCALSFAVAKQVALTFAVDVSETITGNDEQPDNFRLVISDGTSIPVPAQSISFAYSNQLMEHLHPDDATEQLHNVFDALKPGGRYLCVTPSPLNGPHDISAGFDDTATCFHLKEYTVSELATLFRSAGFIDICVVTGFGGRFFRCPLAVATGAEKLVRLLPAKWARAVAGAPLVRNVLYPRVIGTKPV